VELSKAEFGGTHQFSDVKLNRLAQLYVTPRAAKSAIAKLYRETLEVADFTDIDLSLMISTKGDDPN
jgi:hypothetical protein